MKLEVPYYSQFVDIQDPFWMVRACGAVAIKSVAEFHGIAVPELLTICNDAKEKGGYDMENGWVHDYIVSYFQGIGLNAYRKEGLTDLNELLFILETGTPLIVSVEKRVLEQTRFHIIVIVGFEKDANGAVTHLYYHESESTNKDKGAYRVCDMATFMSYWRGKVIVGAKSIEIS